MDALADGGRDPASARASTRREPSFAARGTIAVVAGRQKMAPIAHARAAALGRTLPLVPRGGHDWFRREAVIEQTQTLIGAPPSSTPSTSPLARVGFGSK